MGIAVLIPWPTSGFGEKIVMVPSGEIKINGLKVKLSFKPESAGFEEEKPNNNPPPATAVTLMKDLLDTENVGLFIIIGLFVPQYVRPF